MKFVPRPPQSTQRLPPRATTTTRFLRLQPAEDLVTEEPRPESRPLPVSPEPSKSSGPRTASQRVRLRLDPEVATKPLPDAAQLLGDPLVASLPAPTRFPKPTPAGPEPAAPALDQSEPQEEPLAVETPLESTPVAADPVPELFEQPIADPVNDMVWVPPGPGSEKKSTWLPPVTAAPLSYAEHSAPRREPMPENDVPVAAETPGSAETLPAAAYESRRLDRPKLRRAITPLADLTRPGPSSLGRGFWFLLALLVIALVALLYIFELAPRLAAYQAQIRATKIIPARPVLFIVARLGTPASELPVSGAVEPSRETPLYARTTGYVKNWTVDLGDKVAEGQILAELDTPEVDHQLVQARASADQAKAQVALAQNEADRWAKMAADHAVSQSDADAKTAALNEAQANFNAAEANVGRLADLEMFKQIRAPYAGTITARNLEIGTLVGAGPQGKELFRVTQTDPVRVFVNVPEASAPLVHAGIVARVEVAAYPGREFTGEIVRDAGALDPTTHTLRTEVHVANPDGTLLPGTPASVRLQFVDATPALLIPTSSLIMSRQGAAIARLVSSDGREIVRLTPVKIGRTFGAEVELLDHPLNSGDRLVANPPDDLRDGMIVIAQPIEQVILEHLRPPHASAPRA